MNAQIDVLVLVALRAQLLFYVPCMQCTAIIISVLACLLLNYWLETG